MFGKLKFIAIVGASAAGILWVVNLPYPMIRHPIAKSAPLLLLPSFMSMDHHYRGAIDSLAQADQLITNATSTADIELGGEKVKAAKKDLEQLPVWFLGYYPQRYCSMAGCSWQFTLDEFEEARKRVATLEAVVFQDKNALLEFNQAKQPLLAAKEQYKQAQNTKDRENAIAAWQEAIDKLDQMSQTTYAGKNAQTQLTAYKRDFDYAKVATYIAAAQEFDIEADKMKSIKPQAAAELWQQAITRLEQVPNENPRYLDAQKLIAAYQVKEKTFSDPRTSNLIEAGKQYALAAAKLSQNPPHTVKEWEQIGSFWQKAIQQLESISANDSSYVEAQKLLAQYHTNLGVIENRRDLENKGQEILEQANKDIKRLIASPPTDKNQMKAEIQDIITQLSSVKPGTTSYAEAQRLFTLANNKLKKLQ